MNEEKKAVGSGDDTMQNVVEGFLPKQAQPLDPNLVQKEIRTYESDLADALSKKGGSVASISIAEARRKEMESRKHDASTEPVPPSPSGRVQNPDFFPRPAPIPTPRPAYAPIPPQPSSVPVPPQIKRIDLEPRSQIQVMQAPPRRSFLKPIIFTLLSLVFITGGLFVGYYMLQETSMGKPDAAPVTATFVVPSVIPNDKQVTVLAGNVSGAELITKMYAEINKNSIEAGKSLELVLVTESAEGNTRQMSGSAFMQKIGMRMPDVIFRSLTDRWMFGVYAEENGEKTSYVALTTDFFQNAFAGMLIWEDTMPDDLAVLLDYKERARKDELTSTSTISSYFDIRGDFRDKVIRNRDVRIFTSPQGELLFLYSFINKETLVITTTESSFVALVDRIEKESYVR